MKKAISLAVALGTVLSSLGLVGCGNDGPTASTEQLTQSRDKQAAAMAKQRGVAAGAQSADAAGKTPNK